MRVLVCGGRDWGTKLFERQALYRALHEVRPTVIIEGGAAGADARAREWARYYGVANETFPADWRKHGKAAGPIRNRQMLDTLLKVCGPATRICIATDLTLEDESIQMRTADQWRTRELPNIDRRPTVFLLQA